MRVPKENTEMEGQVASATFVRTERIGIGFAVAGTLVVLLLLPLFFVATLIYGLGYLGTNLYAATKRKKRHREWTHEKLKYTM